jgi:hypothetical protein
VVLTIPKRLRGHSLYRCRLLGQIARVAARTITVAIHTLTGEHDLADGIVACLHTHRSRANWHPHLHLRVTDGGFRPDGTFVSWPVHETARLTEAFRRAVLRLFVRLELFDEDQATVMLTWRHSGFHVHTAVWVPEDDRAFATSLARYCARNPVALQRLTYDRVAKAVTYRSAKSEGPTAGTDTVDPLELLARVLVHIPDNGHVTPRYYGWYASRRWATLLQQILEVDPACPTSHGPTRVVAFIPQASVIDRILAHLRTRAAREARARAQSPHRRGPPRAGASHGPHGPANPIRALMMVKSRVRVSPQLSVPVYRHW